MSRRIRRRSATVHSHAPVPRPDDCRPGKARPMDSGIDTAARVTPRATRAVTEPPPLRVGLMLRAVDDVDGQGIYIRELCDALFDLDTRNHYVALYWREDQAGRYRDRPNVREVVV